MIRSLVVMMEVEMMRKVSDEDMDKVLSALSEDGYLLDIASHIMLDKNEQVGYASSNGIIGFSKGPGAFVHLHISMETIEAILDPGE